MKNISKIKITAIIFLFPILVSAQSFFPSNPDSRVTLRVNTSGELTIRKDTIKKVVLTSNGDMIVAPGGVDTGGDTTMLNVTSRVVGSINAIGVNAFSLPATGYGVGTVSFGGLAGYEGGAVPFSPFPSFGGYFRATGGGGGSRYGVYACASGSTHNMGVYSNGPSYSMGAYLLNDEKLKKNVAPLNNCLNKIMKLNPSTFNYKTTDYDFMNLPQEMQYGFVARDLETVFPEMAKEIQQPLVDRNGNLTHEYFSFKGFNYDQLIAVLAGAIQEEHTNSETEKENMQQQLHDKNEIIARQQDQINALKTRMDQFENDLMKCCNKFETRSEKNTGEKVMSGEPTLEQNAPNPFSENTIVKYYLPSTVKQASIKVTSLNGKLIKSYPIELRGANILVISGKELKDGSYLYTLNVDSKTIESKLMILTK